MFFTGCSPSGNIHLLQHGVISVDCRMGICSNMAFSTGCKGISSLTPGAPPPFLFLSPCCLQGCFSHVCFSVLSLNCCTAVFYPFLNIFSHRCHHLGLRCSAVSCGGFTGTGWNWLCLAQDSSWAFLLAAPQPQKKILHSAKICIVQLWNYCEYLD